MTLNIFVESVTVSTSKGYVKRYQIICKEHGKSKEHQKPFVSQTLAIDHAKVMAVANENKHPYHPDSKNNTRLFIDGSKNGAYMVIKGQFVEFRDVP